MRRSDWLAAVALIGMGCGGGGNVADPRLIAGGGVGDGEVDGRVNVYVIDSETDAAIAGAEVVIGEPGATALTGVTDSTGLFTLDDDALGGPTTITATASGYVPSTWFGANGANITVPLSPTSPSTSVPQAQLTGGINGWDAVPTPATNHLTLALVLYSQTRELGGAANNLPQPGGGGGGLPGNACGKSPLGAPACAWTVNVRTGAVVIYAILVDIDTKGTPEDTDDTNEVIGFALKRGVIVEDGVDQSGIMLDMVDVGTLVDVTVETETPPAGVDAEQTTVVGIDAGDEGNVLLGVLQSGTGITVPNLTGPFADASYLAFAITAAGPDDADPSTAIIRRGITDAASAIEMGPWLPLPTNLAESGGEYSFTAAEGAALHSANFEDGNRVWEALFLDGRTTFTVPGTIDDPIPTTAYDMVVTAIDGDVDLGDFSISEESESFERIADNRATITP